MTWTGAGGCARTSAQRCAGGLSFPGINLRRENMLQGKRGGRGGREGLFSPPRTHTPSRCCLHGRRWTVTDTCLSPDQRFVIYASITPVAHLVAVGSHWDGVIESISNITEVGERSVCGGGRGCVEGEGNGAWMRGVDGKRGPSTCAPSPHLLPHSAPTHSLSRVLCPHSPLGARGSQLRCPRRGLPHAAGFRDLVH